MISICWYLIKSKKRVDGTIFDRPEKTLKTKVWADSARAKKDENFHDHKFYFWSFTIYKRLWFFDHRVSALDMLDVY